MSLSLIRPGNLPFRLGLKPPAGTDGNENAGNCHDMVNMTISQIIHHDENSLQHSPQLTVQFHAVDQTTGQCLPLTKALVTSELPLSKSSYLKTFDDGNIVYHETQVDLFIDYTELLSENTLFLFEITGAIATQRYNPRKCKAWGFVRPMRLFGGFLSNKNTYGDRTTAQEGTKTIDVQLFKWRRESLLVRAQTEHHIIPKGNLDVPKTFIQYLMQRRQKYNSCLCVIVKSTLVASFEKDREEEKE